MVAIAVLPTTELDAIFQDFRAFTEFDNLDDTRQIVERAVVEVEEFARALQKAVCSELLDPLSDGDQPQVDAALAWHLHQLSGDLTERAERLGEAAAKMDEATSALWLNGEIAVKMS